MKNLRCLLALIIITMALLYACNAVDAPPEYEPPEYAPPEYNPLPEFSKENGSQNELAAENINTAYADIDCIEYIDYDNLKYSVSMQPGSTALIIKDDGTVWYQEMNYYEANPMIKIMDDCKAVWNKQWVSFMIDNNDSLWGWRGLIDSPIGVNTGNAEYPYYAGEPTLVMESVKAFDTGYFSLAVKQDNSLWIWGTYAFSMEKINVVCDNYYARKLMDNVQKASASVKYGLAIKTDNSLWSWYTSVHPITGEIEYIPFKLMENVKHVDKGLAIACDDSLWRFVRGESIEQPLTPQKLMDNIIAVSASGYYYMVLNDNNQLFAWPFNHKDPDPRLIAENCASIVGSWSSDAVYMIDANKTLNALIIDDDSIQSIALEDEVVYATTSLDRILLYVKQDGSLWRVVFSPFISAENGDIVEDWTGEITANVPRVRVMEKVLW